MPSDALFHVEESARAARAAHAHMMRDQSGEPLYVYFKPRRLEAWPESERPGEEWQLAWPERVPSDLSVDQLVYWFASRSGKVPYLT